jgi:uncharacterized membrane protein YdjX (TVP38/TMEM64 family)
VGVVYRFWGIPIALVTASFAASLAFLIARHLARNRSAQCSIQRRRVLAAIDEAVAEDPSTDTA